jgi:hypothetical protein
MKISSLVAASVLGIALVSLSACGGGKSANNAANTAASAAGNVASAAGNAASGAMDSMGSMTKSMPNCGAVKPVWVNLNSKVYHEPGDPYYGKTKHGEFLCPSQAKAQGYHRSGAATTSQ